MKPMFDLKDNQDSNQTMPNVRSFSQAGQDVFAFLMTEGKRGGTFLDIGCNHESFHSNTYGLEGIGWTGLMVDIVGGCENRKGKFLMCDAAGDSEALKFAYSQLPAVVDYLSLDADDATIRAMRNIPWSKVTFRVITAEHDSYRVGPDGQREMFKIFDDMGYVRVCKDVIITGYGIAEDWYVHPDLVNPELIQRYTCDGQEWQEILKR